MPAPIQGKQLAESTVTTRELNTTDGGISTVNAGDSAVEGSGLGAARRDHQHAVSTGTPTGTVEIADTGVEGTSSSLARSDHVHPVGTPSAPANVNKGAAAAGTSVIPARSDHEHDVDTATAVELTDATNAEGSSASLARADHTHSHGSRGGGGLHALATSGANGFMSASDKAKLDSLSDAIGLDLKEAVVAATTAPGTLSSDFEDGDTIDGVVLATGDRILIKNQATASENGIYVVQASGAPSRASDLPVAASASGAIVPVDQGTANKDTIWFCVSDVGSDVVGTNDLSFALQAQGAPRIAGDGLVLDANNYLHVNTDGASTEIIGDQVVVKVINDTQHGDRSGGSLHADVVAGGADGFMTGSDKSKLDGIEPGATNETFHQERITTEAINNSDVTLADTLDAVPKSTASVLLFLNGVQQIQGVGEDYTISGQAITWLASTGTAVNMQTNDDLIAYYVS